MPPGLGDSATRHEEEKSSSTGGLRNLLRFRKFQNVLILYSRGCTATPLTAVLNGVMFSWEAVFPLFAFTDVDRGGLGLTVRPTSAS